MRAHWSQGSLVPRLNSPTCQWELYSPTSHWSHVSLVPHFCAVLHGEIWYYMYIGLVNESSLVPRLSSPTISNIYVYSAMQERHLRPQSCHVGPEVTSLGTGGKVWIIIKTNPDGWGRGYSVHLVAAALTPIYRISGSFMGYHFRTFGSF